MHYIYILECADNSLYTGWTTNLEHRIKTHNLGKGAKYTRSRLPVKLAYYEIYDNKKDALSREWHLKHLSHQEKSNIVKRGRKIIQEKVGDKTVITLPCGINYITEPIKISGKNIEIIGTEHTVLRACVQIGKNKWKKDKNGRFYTKTDTRADGFYVNSEKYTMARYPKFNEHIQIFGGYSSDCISSEKAKEWKNPKGAYIHAMHSHHWGGYSYEVSGKNTDNELTYFGGWQNNRQMGMHSDFRFIENIYEEMTLEKEWCFDIDNMRLYAIPDKKNSLKNAEACINSSFFIFENCENVYIKNIKFERSARTFMLTKEPLLRSDWTIYRGGAVYFNNCKNVSLSECVFSDIGSNAIFADGKNDGICIEKCLIENVGASGVCFVGGSDSVRNPLFEFNETQSINDIDLGKGPKSDNYPRNCVVKDCLIRNIGTCEKQSAGVQISMSSKISVINTTIHSTSRAGINISEGTFGGHLIDGCDVFDTVKETGDHGSFNSWGRDRYWHAKDLDDKDTYKYAFLDCVDKNIIRNSRFRCDRGWDIDLDDGSSNYEIYNNLCLNGGIKLREGISRNVHHNITVNNTVHMHVWYPNSQDTVENNILFTPYAPIMMNYWGKKIGNNILHAPNTDTPVCAEELFAVCPTDISSQKTDCMFSNPEKCDFSVNNPNIRGFEAFPNVFGVRHEPLRKLAKSPKIPSISSDVSQNDTEVSSFELFDMKLKNIDTDGEMSAYATSGHDGVIVLDVSHFGITASMGLLPGDVIVEVNGKKILSVTDLYDISTEDFVKSQITLIRAQKKTVIS